MNKGKRVLAAILAAVLAVGLSTGCAREKKQTASVQSVGMLMGMPSLRVDRYAGVVVSQSETVIQKEESKTIDQMMVSEGDEVTEGQVLFTYNMEDLALTIQKTQLEIEQLAGSVNTYAEQIAQLEQEKRGASGSEQLSYTVQIQGLVLDQKEAQYNMSVKQAELANLQASAADNQVVSPVNGHVQSIHTDGGTGQNGAPLPLMTIVESGVFRVKGTINELNRESLTQGASVLIRSRTDETKFWRGTIDVINWDSPQTQDNSGGGVVISSNSASSSDADTGQSSSYPFFITPEDVDGLMLGQHVYIEPDFGQADENAQITLDQGYIVMTDNGAYVWAASSRSTLERRSVTLGARNEETGTYVIEDGLTMEDYIAWPDASLAEGMRVVYYDESTFGQDAGEDGEVMPEEGGEVLPEEGGEMPSEEGGEMPSEDGEAVPLDATQEAGNAD